jgi:archaellum component FlaC
MKNKIIKIIIGLVLNVFMISVAGCATTGPQKSVKAGTGLQKAADKMKTASATVDSAVVAMNDLVNNPEPDLTQQYKTFSNSVEKLKDLRRDVELTSANVSKDSQAYFDYWNQQLPSIRSEELRSRSIDRKQDVRNQLREVKMHTQEVKTNLEPFADDLKDIQKTLGVDLTQDGIETIRKAAARVNDKAPTVKQSISSLAADYENLSAKMMPSAAPEGSRAPASRSVNEEQKR